MNRQNNFQNIQNHKIRCKYHSIHHGNCLSNFLHIHQYKRKNNHCRIQTDMSLHMKYHM